MIVEKLIELLQKENPKAMVVVNGYEGGYDEARRITQRIIVLNDNKDHAVDYFGEHDDSDLPPDGEKIVKAVLIPRN